MRQHMLLRILALTILVTLFVPYPAHAYIDIPAAAAGSSGAIWAVIAPFVAMGVAFLGLMIRPVRMFFRSLIGKLLGWSGTGSIAADEQAASGYSPEGDGSGEDTSGHLGSK